MSMLSIVAVVVALAGLVVSLVLAGRVAALEGRIRSAERELESPPPAPALPEPEAMHPLEGLKVGLAIEQDHAHPVFANLFKEQLLRAGVAEVVFSADADVVVSGKVVCNGYAEVYYEADLACRLGQETICTLAEKPPTGDRPANLALELVTKLETELDKLIRRSERRRAIRELQG